MSGVSMAELRSVAYECRILGLQYGQWIERRDNLALRCVDEGETWRDVAEAAGFKNPYMLKRSASLAAARADATSDPALKVPASHIDRLVEEAVSYAREAETLRDALERLVADLETNSEDGAPDYAHAALAAARANAPQEEQT